MNFNEEKLKGKDIFTQIFTLMAQMEGRAQYKSHV